MNFQMLAPLIVVVSILGARSAIAETCLQVSAKEQNSIQQLIGKYDPDVSNAIRCRDDKKCQFYLLAGDKVIYRAIWSPANAPRICISTDLERHDDSQNAQCNSKIGSVIIRISFMDASHPDAISVTTPQSTDFPFLECFGSAPQIFGNPWINVFISDNSYITIYEYDENENFR